MEEPTNRTSKLTNSQRQLRQIRSKRKVHEAEHAVDHPLPSSRGRDMVDHLQGVRKVFHDETCGHDW